MKDRRTWPSIPPPRRMPGSESAKLWAPAAPEGPHNAAHCESAKLWVFFVSFTRWDPGSIRGGTPQFRYLLVDEHRIPEEQLADENLLAGLIGLEKTESLEGLLAAFSGLLKWVRDPAIRRAFAVTVRVILIRLGVADAELGRLNDPEEVETMLAENLMDWRDRVREEGQLAGEARILSRLLKLKFGPLDDTTAQRISETDSETLLRCADRVLTATSLSEVFDDD